MPPWIQAAERPKGHRTTPRASAEQPWYRITNATADEAEILLYDEVGGWFGATADEFIEDLSQVTASKLKVRVNSPGGSVFEGIAISNALRAHPADVTVQVDGLAASIASVIALAGDRLVMQPNSMLMIHDASGLCMGDAADMQQMAGLLDAISDNIASAYAAKAGGTAAGWRALMKAESWYSAEQAVEAGLADAVGKQRGQAEAEPEMRKTFDPQAYGYTGPKEPEKPPLTIDIAALLGDAVVEQLRASVVEATTPAAVEDPATDVGVEDATVVEDAAPAQPADVEEPAEPEPPAEPINEWGGSIAHLTTTHGADDWSASTAHLTSSPASSGAATSA